MLGLTAGLPVSAQAIDRDRARQAAIHAVGSTAEMRQWLRRVPMTRDFPPDFADALKGQAGLFVIEMTSAPGCLPCDDLWLQLNRLRALYGWQVRILSGQDAMLRSGRLGLPWVGHPIAWVRPWADAGRMIPVAIGTDHSANLARNLYLAGKMLTGVRPAVAVRAMSKFTGIVAASPSNRR
ncbi:hypothetical protein [Sphingomonas sp. OTU376]|uniref:hypothetical protein n=1 Tax=Sphingomonas sp. OTU376 TaxID=3043863 RepID=UPI00313D60C0